jgi:1-deoxy-D-xylulose-5-phosphate synthase
MGEAEILTEGRDLLIIALGSMVSPAKEAATALEQDGIRTTLVNCRFVKPLDPRLAELASNTGNVVIVEENTRLGGLGSACLEAFNEAELENIRVRRIGLPDQFIEHGTLSFLKQKYGLDATGIAREARDLLKRSTKRR